MASIGERIRSAREAQGITLEDAGQATKVQRSILAAIETDRVEDVLEPAYAKIFIKKYASFLKLNGTALVEEFLAKREEGSPGSHLAVEPEATRLKRTLPPVSNVLIPAGLGLVGLVGIVFLGSSGIHLYRSLAARAQAKPVAVADSSVASRALSSPLVPLSRQLKLTIQTSDEVWLQVKSDGSVVFQNVLPKEASETWAAKKELELWTGNAAAMELHLNGKPLGSLGRGVRKGVKVTHRGLEFPK